MATTHGNADLLLIYSLLAGTSTAGGRLVRPVSPIVRAGIPIIRSAACLPRLARLTDAKPGGMVSSRQIAVQSSWRRD